MRTLALAFSILTLPAFACPNLAGKYATCRSSTGATGGTSNLVVTQKVINNVTHFTIVSTDDDTRERITETYIADGKKRVASQSEDGFTIKTETIASCKGAELNLSIKAFLNTDLMADMKMKVTKNGTTMTQVATGTSMGEPIKDTVICK